MLGCALVLAGPAQPGAAHRGTSSDQHCGNRWGKTQLYQTVVDPLVSIDGVTIVGSGFGSSLAPVPGTSKAFYGLTDRGPNVATPSGLRIEPLPDFVPTIGRFRLARNGRAVLERTIPLHDPSGTPLSGRLNSAASTGETIVDLQGNPLPADTSGYDAEGLVALPDGTFWVSDEYGPFITHFDASGRELKRLAPQSGALPAELARRTPNRGMEGLTVTPDGSTLVGIMQSPLAQDDQGTNPAVTPVRVVTYHLRTGSTQEYLYLLDNPATNAGVVSEITALSSTRFVVIERDGLFPPTAVKRLWRIDLSGATDVGPLARVPGTTYRGDAGGLLIAGHTIEGLVGVQDTATATATLLAAGIRPVAKSLFLDLTSLLADLDPKSQVFSHDKVEGLVVLDRGRRVLLSNDSDFGLADLLADDQPYQLRAKLSPTTGHQDTGEFLLVDLARNQTCR
ncbi:MAG: esterase-like activity of phytase family protein [Micromonosporaceae bacterium]|nr:esterase-like activity of phytase family protein [Micromonosporaceae bacterium]